MIKDYGWDRKLNVFADKELNWLIARATHISVQT